MRTFSITFDSPEFDETAYQRQVVDALGTDHQAIRCTRQDIGQVFPEVIWHAEQPILRTAPAPMFLLSELVHDGGYKVVLTGEGADEMFGGYDIFKEAKVRRFWAAEPESAFRALLLGRLYPYLPNMRAQSLAYRKAFFHVRPEDLDNPLFSHLPRWELTSRLKAFCTADVQAAMRGHDVYADCLAMLPPEFAGWPPFCQAQYLETATLLPGYILSSQGDRMAMAHGVEGRYPFLDHRVAEFAARVPPRLKMKGLREKYLLKRATRHSCPRRSPGGPSSPIAPRRREFLRARRFRAGAAVRRGAAFAAADRGGRAVRAGGGCERWSPRRAAETAIGFKDNMALVGILSTQLVVEQFVRNFAPPSDRTLDEMEPREPVGVLGPDARRRFPVDFVLHGDVTGWGTMVENRWSTIP